MHDPAAGIFCLYFGPKQSASRDDYLARFGVVDGNENHKHFKPAVSELIFFCLFCSQFSVFCEMRSLNTKFQWSWREFDDVYTIKYTIFEVKRGRICFSPINIKNRI